MPSEDDYHSKVDDLYSREEFERKIEEKYEEYDGLLDKLALAQMIVAEEGRNDEMIKDIADIEVDEEITIQGEVVDLGTLRTFKTDRGEGRVRNVRLDDGTGSVKLVLWNEETDRVGDDIDIGDQVRVICGYVQDRGYGLQIKAGRWGEIRVKEGSEND